MATAEDFTTKKTTNDDESSETLQQEQAPTETQAPPPPPSKTMLSYFTKLPSKAIVVEEANPRKLAPAFNRQHVEKFQSTRLEQFDADLFNFHSTNYLETIESGQHKPFRLQRKIRGAFRAKLLQYHEDVRPPYYGTWQRKSKIISGRRPFAQDEDVFDYEVDSEAEWDLGGPGESLKGDDSEEDEELDDYEIDMKTFVPHGYVSDDEMEVHSDQEEGTSADQSTEETCDVEDDSNVSVLIVGEKMAKGAVTNGTAKKKQQPQQQQAQTISRNSSPAQAGVPQLPPSSKQKPEIKPISLGLYYEDAQTMMLSESKLLFLRAFQGCSCK